MKALTCAATRRRLHAFHDDELQVSDQIAVSAHLDWCRDCANAFGELRLVRAALRSTAPGRAPLSQEEAAGFQAAVVNRAKAEADASFLARVRGMFDDMHLVYAGLGATAATVVCVMIMLGMMRFATIERPDSLAAIVNILATPGSNENPVAVDGRVRMPRALDGAFSTGSNGSGNEDAVFALAAVVTREGRIENLELLRSRGGESAETAKLIESLMNSVARARFEPARVADSLFAPPEPIAVNMVWLVAHTTVRGTKNPTALDLPVLPIAKKRAASLASGPSRVATA